MAPRSFILLMSLAMLGSALAGCGGKAPASPAVQVQPHSVTLTWDASVSPVSGYRVYRATSASAQPVVVAITPANTTQYTDTSVEPGKTYFYAVKAFDSDDQESVFSNRISATIPTR